MNNKEKISHHISKDKEGTYYTLDFMVPPGLETIKISYHYSKFSAKGKKSRVNVVDLGLMDEKGLFLGWSGSARKTITVGKHTSTNGYLQTDIAPGTWQIIVGAYKIPSEGLEVQYEIEYVLPKAKWFTGDLHMHSTASDGQHDIYTLTKKAQKQGLDFIAVSNHNNYSENLHLPKVAGLTLLPAVEWTHYRGHMNFFGVRAPFENSFVANTQEEMENLIATARQKGAIISANHPKCPYCPYLWENDKAFDVVEVWNGPMTKRNTDAIGWWHSMLVQGRKIPLVGGSDFHKDRHFVRFAQPVTRIYAKSPSETDLLEGIKKGHSYVVAKNKGLTFSFCCNHYIMGDSVVVNGSQYELLIKVEGLKPFMEVNVVTNKGISHTFTSFSKGRLNKAVQVDSAWSFAYITVTKKLFNHKIVKGITNPIYFDKNQ